MQVIRNLFIALLAAAFALTAAAQVQQARGKASVPYKGAKAAPADIKAKAVQNAQLKAVEFYYAEAGESEAANFDAMRSKIIETPDRYILETTVLSEEDQSGQQYTVAVRVSLNVANLRNDIKAGSAVAKVGRTERSALAFLFVSREVDSIKSYDTRVTKRADASLKADASAQVAQKGSEGERVRRNQIDTNASMSETASVNRNISVTTETGGTQTRRAAESTWRLFPSANLNQVFTQTFTRAGFKVNEAALVEPYTEGRFKVSQVEDDYKAGNDLKAATMQAITQGMRIAKIPYMALGTLDLGLADRDPATGMQRVSVTVNARILDVSQPIPDTIASVGPVQYAGVGPTEDEARTNALKLAANNAARELTSQVTNLGLK